MIDIETRSIPSEHRPIFNGTKSMFIAPMATVSLIEYLIAADTLVNLEYRLERLIAFSKRSIQYIHEQWGVPEPFNFVAFVGLSLLSIVVSQKLLGKLIGRSSGKSSSSFRFN